MHRNQSHCAAASEGEQLVISGTVLRYGKTLGFTSVEVRRPPASDGTPGKLIATGRHTKFFPEKKG